MHLFNSASFKKHPAVSAQQIPDSLTFQYGKLLCLGYEQHYRFPNSYLGTEGAGIVALFIACFLSKLCRLLFHLFPVREEEEKKPEQQPKKNPFTSFLLSTSWSTSFCKWPNSKFTSSVLEHHPKRLVRQKIRG